MTMPVPDTGPIEVRELCRPEEFARCEALYREVFALGLGDGSINARLLVGLVRNSGIVVGAYNRGELVGFALSFLAYQSGSGRLYEYSQTAAVLPSWQGLGVGRALKFAQREAALDRQITLMRWTFDPVRSANAHFNLDVLGGVVTGLARDLYGASAAPEDRGQPTDRFIVEWELEGDRVTARLPRPPAGRASALGDGPRMVARGPCSQPARVPPGQVQACDGGVLLGIPAEWHRQRRRSPARSAVLRGRIADRVDELFAAGLVGVSCTRLDDEAAVYLFCQP